MSEKTPSTEFLTEDARIDALEKRLAAVKEREEERNRPKSSGTDANYSMGNRVLADLLGGILGGLVFGWLVDVVADTKPWGLMVGLFLGIIVAFRNIIRMASTQSSSPSDEG